MNMQKSEMTATLIIVLSAVLGWSYLLLELSSAFGYPTFA